MSNTIGSPCGCGSCIECAARAELDADTIVMTRADREALGLTERRYASGETVISLCLCAGGVDDLGRPCPFCRRNSSVPPPPEAA